MQMVALRALEGVPLLIAEAAEIWLPDAWCLAEHGLGHAQACVEIAGALVELPVVRQILHGVEQEE